MQNPVKLRKRFEICLELGRFLFYMAKYDTVCEKEGRETHTFNAATPAQFVVFHCC